MRKFSVIVAAALMVAVVGCGKEPAPQQESAPAENTEQGVAFEPVTETEQTAEAEPAAEAGTLGVPQLTDGVMQPGEEAIEVQFTWEPVEGADGYEVEVANKFYEETEYRDDVETSEVTAPSYVCGAQDYFDFRIKVRAFKGAGADRVYGDWSSFAEGSTYTEADIAAEGN